MNCTQCGSPIQDGFAFCTTCGAPAPVAEPEASSHASAFCTQCGAPLSAGSGFCTQCGAAVAAAKPEPTVQPEPASVPVPEPEPQPEPQDDLQAQLEAAMKAKADEDATVDADAPTTVIPKQDAQQPAVSSGYNGANDSVFSQGGTAQMPPNDPFAPKPAAGASFCTSCGAEIPAGMAFCINCGASVGGGVQPSVAAGNYNAGNGAVYNASQPVEKKKGKGGLIAGIIVIVLLVAAIAGVCIKMFACNDTQSTQDETAIEQSDATTKVSISSFDTSGFPSSVRVAFQVMDEDGATVKDLSVQDFSIVESDSSGSTYNTTISSCTLDDMDIYWITYETAYTTANSTHKVKLTCTAKDGAEATSSYTAPVSSTSSTSTTNDPYTQTTVDISCQKTDASGGGYATGTVTRSGTDSSGAMCVLPDSATHKYTASELSGLSSASLAIARNEIYARHGYNFKNQGLHDYFATYFKGYSGTVNDQGNISLNATEQANAELILEIENGDAFTTLKTE